MKGPIVGIILGIVFGLGFNYYFYSETFNPPDWNLPVNEYKIQTDSSGKYYVFSKLVSIDGHTTKYGEWRKVGGFKIGFADQEAGVMVIGNANNDFHSLRFAEEVVINLKAYDKNKVEEELVEKIRYRDLDKTIISNQ